MLKVRIITLIIAIIACDQWSKNAVFYLFENVHIKKTEIFFWLDFVYYFNRGVSFGFMNEYQYSNIVFLILASILSVIVLIIMIKSDNKLDRLVYAMIFAGATSNIIDRIIHGAVMDFIYIHIGDYAWPAFNLADAAISIGAVILVCNSMNLGSYAKK